MIFETTFFRDQKKYQLELINWKITFILNKVYIQIDHDQPTYSCSGRFETFIRIQFSRSLEKKYFG